MKESCSTSFWWLGRFLLTVLRVGVAKDLDMGVLFAIR